MEDNSEALNLFKMSSLNGYLIKSGETFVMQNRPASTKDSSAPAFRLAFWKFDQDSSASEERPKKICQCCIRRFYSCPRLNVSESHIIDLP
jgi:hypothetical protein